MRNIQGVVEQPVELTALETLVGETEARAARARSHAALAREHARRDAERGDVGAERLHLREADAHDAAATVTEQTAALYRSRIDWVRSTLPGRSAEDAA